MPEATPPPTPDRSSPPPRGYAILPWLLGGVMLCTGLGVAAVSRTQEARVLETAREMLGSEPHNWLVPRVNGHVRLQKPPLAYWLTAVCFRTLGVGEGSGRLPAALSGWLTLGVTALAASWLFGRRTALFAAATLLGSFLFFRHARLAETDIVVTLFVTCANYALWRGCWAAPPGAQAPRAPEPPFVVSALWFHAAAVAIALAALAKGPPAAYPLLFLVALVSIERRWRALLRFVLCGAPLTAAVIALPWFLYVSHDPQFEQLTRDLKNSAGGGRGHVGPFYDYFFWLLLAAAPWSALWPPALWAAVAGWRRDPRLRGLLLWVGCVLLPLCAWRNKQMHYLLPLMPPLMVLVGRLLDQSLTTSSSPGGALAGLTRRLVGLTAVAMALVVPGLFVAATKIRGTIRPIDVALAASVLAALAALWLVYRRRGAVEAFTAMLVGNVALLAAVIGLWDPTLRPLDMRAIASSIRARYGEGPYALVARDDLPLVFSMRQILPVARTDVQTAEIATRRPQVIGIQPMNTRDRPRAAIAEAMRFRERDTTYRVGPLTATATTEPSPAGPPEPEQSDE